jgi:multidrug efflux pump subunit AcrB
MRLTRLAIENDRISLFLSFLVVVAGITAFFTLPKAQNPGFTIRTAVVTTAFPGASPERVERLVTKPIEDKVSELPELDFVESESRQGLSIVQVNIKSEYYDLDPIWDQLRRKVNDVESTLPNGVFPPQVDDEFGDVFGMVYALSSEDLTLPELDDLAEDIRDELLLLEDIAKVEFHGSPDERIYLEFSNARLADWGITPNQLQQSLQATNIVVSGGEVVSGMYRIPVEPSGSFDSVDELRDTVINIPGTENLVKLSDVVSVRRGIQEPPTELARANGKQSIVIVASMREGGVITDLGEKVRATFDRAEQDLPIGVELEEIYWQPDLVRETISTFTGNVGQAVAVVLTIMLLFLGFRMGLIISLLVPLAMTLTLTMMRVFSIGLDEISLAALIIALGILVDNGVVVVEWIQVAIQEGMSRKEAAVQSTTELAFPLFVSSGTTIAAFLPIALADSAVGEYTLSLFQVMAITLLASWIIAMTVLPTLCYLLLSAEGEEGEDKTNFADSRLHRPYRNMLGVVLQHRVLAIIFFVLLFVGAMMLGRNVENIFFPDDDTPVATGDIELPLGSRFELTDERAREVEEYLQSLLTEEDEIDYATFVGTGGPRFTLGSTPEQPKASYAFMLISGQSAARVNELARKLDQYVRENFPAVDGYFSRLQLGTPVKYPVQVRIQGEDIPELFARGAQVAEFMRNHEQIEFVTNDWGAKSKKVQVDVLADRALRAGVTNYDIASALQAEFNGVTATQYRAEEDAFPVVLRADDALDYQIDRIRELQVFSNATGASVPLAQVAQVEVDYEQPIRFRRDRTRVFTVSARLTPDGNAAAVNTDLTSWLNEVDGDWPVGYRWELGGEAEEAAKANRSINEQLPFAGLIIVFLIVMQFNSFRKAGIVLATIPFGLIGVIVGLVVFNETFGFMTFLGVISLAGVLINTSIVLLDRVETEEDDLAHNPYDAVVIAGQRRIRPVLLTTATTTAGLTPLYLFGGPLWSSMSIAMIFGLVFAASLTLFLVPALYALVFRLDKEPNGDLPLPGDEPRPALDEA